MHSYDFAGIVIAFLCNTYNNVSPIMHTYMHSVFMWYL